MFVYMYICLYIIYIYIFLKQKHSNQVVTSTFETELDLGKIDHLRPVLSSPY